MESELANRLAGLISGTLDAQERTSFAEALARDPESSAVFTMLKGIGAEALLAHALPFSIVQGATLEVGEGSFFPRILDGIHLSGIDSELLGRVSRVSRGRLPAWFKGRLALAVPHASASSVLPLVVSCQGEEISVQIEDPGRRGE